MKKTHALKTDLSKTAIITVEDLFEYTETDDSGIIQTEGILNPYLPEDDKRRADNIFKNFAGVYPKPGDILLIGNSPHTYGNVTIVNSRVLLPDVFARIVFLNDLTPVLEVGSQGFYTDNFQGDARDREYMLSLTLWGGGGFP